MPRASALRSVPTGFQVVQTALDGRLLSGGGGERVSVAEGGRWAGVPAYRPARPAAVGLGGAARARGGAPGLDLAGAGSALWGLPQRGVVRAPAAGGEPQKKRWATASATPASAKPTPTGATGRGGGGKCWSAWTRAALNRPSAAATATPRRAGASTDWSRATNGPEHPCWPPGSVTGSKPRHCSRVPATPPCSTLGWPGSSVPCSPPSTSSSWTTPPSTKAPKPASSSPRGAPPLPSALFPRSQPHRARLRHPQKTP